jgi:hypothetical protein
VHWVFADFKEPCDSVKRDVRYSIVLESGIPKELVRLIKVCLNETCNKICVGEHLSNTFPIPLPLLFSFA